MRQLGFARLAALLLVAIAAGPLLAAPVEEPVAAPVLTQETPGACPSDLEAALGDPSTPIAAASCQINSDCFQYCCNTYGACSGDSICHRRGFCLC